MNETPTQQADEGVWDRLRRRKVVQWGVAYAAGAWVLLQVLGFAADSFGWPALVKQLAMLSLAVGLPILLTLAWYHGERAQQRVTGQELGILTLLLLIGGGLLWWYASRSVEAPPAVATTRHRHLVYPSQPLVIGMSHQALNKFIIYGNESIYRVINNFMKRHSVGARFSVKVITK